MTRKEALEKNLPKYTTGKPCKHGHLAPRYTKTSICSACMSIRSKEWNRNNPDRRNALSRKWQQDNREQHNQNQKNSIDRRKGLT